jgi:tRNA A-37 threonylcarbamoyl transferase component Bud32/tetratricopeptide (TPR) repeat protein
MLRAAGASRGPVTSSSGFGMTCLDDSTIVRLLAGRLDDSQRSRVEDELGRCGRCAALVAEVARGSSRIHIEPSCPTSPEVQDLDEPDNEARYLLGAEIARGGMGTIFAAFDRRLSRSIAIKRLACDDPLLGARFAREIRITASLQHPGIVPVYDSGRLPEGRPFYAMRHVPGRTLQQAIGDCRSDGERLGLLVSVLAVAEAVAYAHERGIIHRDLKPSNVLVGPFGETVVIDWGLARIDDVVLDDLLDPEPARDPATTRQGTVLGTPRYMAPEQARGEPATRRSDVYALGAILYHTLTGAPPVAGDDVDDVLEQVARAEVRPLAQISSGLPGDLIAIVERAMANRPELRYASAGDLAADLRRFQTGQLVGAYSYSRGDLVRRFVRRHRAAVAVAALFAVALAAGSAFSVHRIVAEREQAEMERASAERERHGAEDLVTYLLHELRAKLATVGRLDVLSGVADRVDAYYATTAAGRAELPDAISERAALYDLRAAVANAAGDGAATERYLDQGLALLDRVDASPRSEEIRAELLGSKAVRLADGGDFARSRALALESVALHRQASSQNPEDRRRRQLNLAFRLAGAAWAADRLGDADDAEREWKEAAGVLEQLRAEGHADSEVALRLAHIEMELGQSRYRRGLPHEAADALQRALTDSQALLAREPKNERVADVFAWSCLSLADVHHATGELAEADRRYEQARATATAMIAIEPASATWQVTLARADMDLGTIALERADWAGAATRFDTASIAYEHLVSRDPTSRFYRRAAAVTIAQLAEADAAMGRTEAARSAWLAALSHLAQLAASNGSEARLEWAYGLRGYAALERQSGRPTKTDEAIEHALRLVEDTPAEKDRPVHTFYRAAVLAELGSSRAAHHRVTEAHQAWSRAAELLRGLARRTPLETDWAKQLKDIEAHLVPAMHGVRGT